jgi:O-antigen ligase
MILPGTRLLLVIFSGLTCSPSLCCSGSRTRPSAVLVVIMRYTGTVRWSTPAIWVYLALAASILVTSAYALLRLRSRSPRARLGSGEQPAVR